MAPNALVNDLLEMLILVLGLMATGVSICVLIAIIYKNKGRR